MPNVTLVQVVYNNKKFMQPVFDAIFKQTYTNFEVVVVISGNEDGGKEFLLQNFPKVTVIDPGYNIGFAKGHNLVFEKYQSDFFQLVNPDLILEIDYVEKMLLAFENYPKLGAATGKLLRYDFEKNEKTNIIDSTGVTIANSGRARDRGQYEIDKGQYDNQLVVKAVSGAGPMYRRSALKSLAISPFKIQNSKFKIQPTAAQYFDEDFHSYWEDVDLTWRMTNMGFECRYVPEAVAYHGRGAGSSKNGYADVVGFIKHHAKISQRIRELNYKNHIFMYLKNSKWLYPQFFIREFFMLGYIVLFEIKTLKVLPDFFKQLPGMWEKRMEIKKKAAEMQS